MLRMFDEIQGKYVGQLHSEESKNTIREKNELDSGKQREREKNPMGIWCIRRKINGTRAQQISSLLRKG